MGRVLVLVTHFNPGQWERDGEVFYQGTSIDPGLYGEIKTLVPIAAIGIYSKGPVRRGTRTDKVDYTSYSPCFLLVDSVEVNEKGEPTFRFRRLSSMEGISSRDLISKIRDWPLYYLAPSERVLKALEELGVRPPEEWIRSVK